MFNDYDNFVKFYKQDILMYIDISYIMFISVEYIYEFYAIV